MFANPLRSRRQAAPVHTPTISGAADVPLVAGEPKTREPYVEKPVRESERSGGRSVPPWISRMGGELGLSRNEIILVASLTMAGAFVRLWGLDWPSSVVFDEVHFGGFANKYLQGKYFVDVHPPLAKLIIALLAKIGGMQGGAFDFHDIGSSYMDKDTKTHVPYVLMRLFPAVMGLLLVPLTYIVLRGVKLRPASALLGALFILFDNALATQSRYILLDSPLVFFTALSIFTWVGFSNEDALSRDRLGAQGPFSRRWWAWLFATGAALGLVLSTKWVGLFTVATVGLFTVMQLWAWLGNLRVPMTLWARHFVARALGLIAAPIVIYMFFFMIHFLVLPNSGDGDGFMSPEFQHTLNGKAFEPVYRDIFYGSQISVRHLNTNGGFLHSHPHPYPAGSQQQQVTLYPHIDSNNHWTIVNQTTVSDAQIEAAMSAENQNRSRIADGDVIILRHTLSAKKLHSHDIKPPVTDVDYQKEVSVYGFPEFDGDANDLWVVEIDKDESDTWRDKKAGSELHAITTKFRLRHYMQGCYLFSHKIRLPEWGYGQQEVTCNRSPTKDNALWFVEWTAHPSYRAEDARVSFKKPSFLSKFMELQKVMWVTNSGLVERHAYDSRPQAWPFLRRGINFWSKAHRQVYLMGNPLVWWLASTSILVYIALRGFVILRAQRGYKDLNSSTASYYDRTAFLFAAGYALHYMPFFLMQRQLFLHHYLPALWFSVGLFATVFDAATRTISPRTALKVALVLVTGVVVVYHLFFPLVAGGAWSRNSCERVQWLRHWDFACDILLPSTADYKNTIVRDEEDVWSSALEAAQAAQSASLVAKLDREAQMPGRPLLQDEIDDVATFDFASAAQSVQVDLDDPAARAEQKSLLAQQEKYVLAKLFPRPESTESAEAPSSSSSGEEGVAQRVLEATSAPAEEPNDDTDFYLSLLRGIQDRKIFIDALERAEGGGE